jgi:palmitoyltransferase
LNFEEKKKILFFFILESFRAPIFANGPQKEGFNLGNKRNFQEIFGTNFLKAILPIFTT